VISQLRLWREAAPNGVFHHSLWVKEAGLNPKLTSEE